jgi:hypothetical protein
LSAVPDFSIWAQIHHFAPHRFAVIVSAVPRHAESHEQPDVRMRLLGGYQEAKEARDAMVLQIGAAIRERGGRVIDVIEE